ncbi:MAG: hypothetical protein QOH31_2357, partial [Verrucomicrobiota bacterium]
SNLFLALGLDKLGFIEARYEVLGCVLEAIIPGRDVSDFAGRKCARFLAAKP